MIVFEIVVLIAAACGLVMVVGGIWLLAKGAITLASAPKTDAITIEWKKQFRINTQVPGIAFFLVGLLFLGFSMYFSRPPDIVPIEFNGQIKNVEEPVTILVSPNQWQIPTASDGSVEGKIYPDLSILLLVVSAPGYEPFRSVVNLRKSGKRLAKLGTLELKKKIAEIKATPDNISAIGFAAPPAGNNQPNFGVAQ